MSLRFFELEGFLRKMPWFLAFGSSFVLSLHLSIIFRHFRYKDFLVNLTPVEWKDQKREEKKQRKLHRRRIAATGLFL